ncbi:MAG: hypothetical protein ACSHX6_01825 [Akkermansiaceae bacterium]
MNKSIVTLLITSSLSLFIRAEEPKTDEKESKPIPGGNMNMSMEQYEETILKVYTAKAKSGTMYKGYVVMWNGSEIVVPDMFGGETKEVGEKIKFMVQEIDMPQFDPKTKGMKLTKMIQIVAMPEMDLEE